MSRFPEVVERMAIDPEFAAHARGNPDEVTAEYGLSPEEAAQMLALTDAGSGGPTELDQRLSKSGIGSGGLAGLLAGVDRSTKDDEDTADGRPLGRWVGPGANDR
ncbi:hypothetical protein Cme02nite_56550 [Catellatospora methionotrophica]|uniref:Uncharacterized protein n=1 Tax=Catellatospora methionotrophica TaxID=121620 RepID=A0A8J3LFG7_9ACTN|nr:hypothetical protein [Catellatospora methionotrophica]GIG17323.1 hypothetical protein Cme02nite_56550 [Catellatospora methionotrophica]